MWPSMVEPLGTIRWGSEGAEKVVFQGEDYSHGNADVSAGGEHNGEMRVLQCTSFTQSQKGLKRGKVVGRLELQPWH